MRSTLEALIGQQGGVFARHQALASGLTTREFRCLTQPPGPWIRVRYGVYTNRDLWTSLDSEGRAALLARAALLMCNSCTALSHSSARRLWGLPLFGVGDNLTHVTRLGPGLATRVECGVKHHLISLLPGEIEQHHGVRVVSRARTVIGISTEFGYDSGLVAADAVLRAGLPRSELVELASRLNHHRRAPVMRAVAADADGRAHTPIETLGRVLLMSMGIDDLELQRAIPLRTGRVAEVDLYSPRLRHVFETDGRLKYVDQVDRFGRTIPASEVVWMEKKREDQVRSLGLGFSRLLWTDVQPDARASTRARLWQEIRDQSAAQPLIPTA